MKMKKLISALCAGAMALSLMSVSAFANTELPTADVEVLTDDSNLLCGLEFTVTETAEEIESKEYKNWIADFEVSFNKDIAKDDIILGGAYDAYENGAWVPLELEADIAAGETVKVMELLGRGEFAYDYIVKVVESFKCGIAQNNADADLSGLVATVALCLYNEDDRYVVASKDVKVLPAYKVSEIDVDGALMALQFDATETEADIADAAYANWIADFELSFNQDVAKDDIVLGGAYNAYENGAWVPLELKADIAAGETVKVMDLLGRGEFAYDYIVKVVKSFKCAVAAGSTDADLGNLVATVDLCLYNGDKKYVVGTKTVAAAAEEVELPPYKVSKLEETVPGYDVLAGLKFDAVQTGDEIEDKVYKNWIADFEVSFNADLDKEDVILAGAYNAYQNGAWTPLELTEDIIAGEAIRVLKVLDNGKFEYPYEYIVKVVESFKCGIAAGSTGADLTDVVASVVLCLYDEDGNRYEVSDVYSFNLGDKAFWITDTDAGYYLVDGDKSGLIRFLFGAQIEGTATETGVKFGKIGSQNEPVKSVASDSKTFYGDIKGVTTDMAGNTYWAMGYAVINGETYWSEPVYATPDFDRLFTAE